ncbi:DNA topoisomerase [Planctomycetia bacterium]|nr:DNA topoisomerase [Planctomycetia bacterium]
MADGHEEQLPETGTGNAILPPGFTGNIVPLAIEDEIRNSYLTYAMSVIISRALPDVRDGLKPSQRRILVAMNDLSLGPNSGRIKCAKICGDTSGNYHPHGEGSVYPTLVRMAQNWNMRETLVDKQGNFGSLAGMPPAAMRYTEARLAGPAADMLHDLDRDTVDFIPTYDQRNMEPVVLPAKFPNLLVNGSNGIAVGMATSIPPHNLGEVCDATVLLIDNPNANLGQILEVMHGPDFPTGGIICGRAGIIQGFATGRSTLTLRARTHFETEKNADVIVITEIPYQDTRDRIRGKLEELVKEERIKGIAKVTDYTDRNDKPWQVQIHIQLKRDADKEVVLNQLFQFSPLQQTVSVILLALVGNRPKVLAVKEMLQEFILHRVDVIRRRTEFLLSEARKRKHTVEGLMIAQIDIDEVIRTIRQSPSRAEAKVRLQQIAVASELIARALGEGGFRLFQDDNGVKPTYSLSPNQSEAIVSMQLGSLANLERDKLIEEFGKLLADITGYLALLSDENNIRAVVRQDMIDMKAKYGDKRRTSIEEGEAEDVNRDDLITEEPMTVIISQRGYVKRTQLTEYAAQNRGGRGVIGAKTEDDDPIQNLFVASTHDWLLFFTDKGKVYWSKVYDLPLGTRTAKGRALVNLLTLSEGEKVCNCVAVRSFDDRGLMIATRKGTVKKTPLEEYSRVKKGGLIAISLVDDDLVVDVQLVSKGESVLLATANGMSIRFAESDARSMGRATQGVRGIRLGKGDFVIGMVIADPAKSLLTVCENGHGKRTPFGIGEAEGSESGDTLAADGDADTLAPAEAEDSAPTAEAPETDDAEASEEAAKSGAKYRLQGRGGKGVRDIKTTARNGKAVDIVAVTDADEILMVTASGKIQRLRAGDISVIGRNTQGVRIIRLEDGDKLVSMACIPAEIAKDGAEIA